MIRRRIWSSLAPSIRAALDSSSGMPRKNCRSRKMKNGFPRNVGTTRGRNVPTQPS
jgi:hypothetical protein